MHLSPPRSALPSTRKATSHYRRAKALPVEVLDHCTVCIEEQLFEQAFSLLTNGVTAGAGSEDAARLPPPQHLALAATLAVHPSLTTRTTSPDKHAAAEDALTYLELVSHVLGSQNAGLDQVFVFGSDDLGSSRNGKRSARPRASDLFGSDDEETQSSNIRSSLAKKDSLWTNAEDFWSLVGWAFNCSVPHPDRWARWRLWLKYMLDVLEDDLETRLPAATRAYEASGSTAAVRDCLESSMFARYLTPIGEGRNGKRRLMRAVLADGKKQAMAEFGEVWKGETRGPKVKKEEPTAKRRKLDLENGLFGDYFDDESDRDSPGGDSMRRSRSSATLSTSRRGRPHSMNNGQDSEDEHNGSDSGTAGSNAIDAFGGVHSLDLRKRLLALLSRFCELNPDAFCDTEDLFDLYTEFLRPLPLPVFTAFALPSKPWLGVNSQASLDQMLLRPLLAGIAPAYDENRLTQAEFERFYAPYAASKTGAVENARVAVLVEGLLRLLWGEGALDGESGRLRKAVEKGIRERSAKSEFDGRRKVGMRAVEDEEAMKMLEAGAERMRLVLDLVDG